MDSDILLSIIVPAYNVAEWLPRCLDSICGQTYKNLEILVIDDGATDKTPQIADRYAAQDRRVRVIHQSNSGLVKARETGIREAKGTYIGFVDGDDEVIPEMYERLLSNAIRYGAQISQCGILYCFYDGRRKAVHGTGEIKVYDHMNGCAALLNNEMEPSLCNKIYMASLLTDSCLDESVVNNEDMLRNIVLFDRAECSVMEDFCGYYYWRRKESMSNNLASIEIGRHILRARKLILDYVPRELKAKAFANYLSGAIHTYNSLIGNRSKEADFLRKKCRYVIKKGVFRYGKMPRMTRMKGIAILFFPPVYDKVQKMNVNRRHKRIKRQVDLMNQVSPSGESQV